MYVRVIYICLLTKAKKYGFDRLDWIHPVLTVQTVATFGVPDNSRRCQIDTFDAVSDPSH